MDKIKGTVSFVVYPRGDGAGQSDFRIVDFRVLNENGGISSIIRAKGPIPSADKDEIIELTGRWINDKKYGKQFEASAAEKIVPETLTDLQVFLAKEITGIGPAMADKIIQRFGTETKSVLADDPVRLSEIPGISNKLALKIQAAWKELTDTTYRSTQVWLLGRGVSPAYAKRLIDKFGGQTVEILTNNPYRATEASRVGFLVADAMAQQMGWEKKSPERLDAAVMHVLGEACNEQGHLFLHIDQLLSKVTKFLGSTEDEIRESIQRLVERHQIILERLKNTGLVPIEAVYLPPLHEAENRLAIRLAELQRYPHEIHPKLDTALGRVQETMHQQFSPKQREGIRNAFAYHVSGVTGGPGTGKTTIVKALVRTAEQLNLECRLGAPTGRAAKRLSEVTGREASTIHRLLEFDPVSYTFTRNRSNPIEADLLIIDESSMLDISLARALFDAVPDDCSVVIIGDADQLPSVGAGTVLRDMIESKTIKFTVLDSIFRQVENSDIVRNAHRIKSGESPQFMPKGMESDCYLMAVPTVVNDEGKTVDDVSYVKKALERLCTQDIPHKLKMDPIKDLQVIVPMKGGDAGTRAINETLQEALNPKGIKIPGIGLRTGDRVMQLSNNYKQDVFNGDIGFVESFDPVEKTVTVDFYGHKVEYTRGDIDEIQLAYAQTIHKSQGSEYPVVLVVLLNQHYIMLERNLLYTATTRARKMCIYLASKKALHIASARHETGNRNSLLNYRLRKAAVKAKT